MEAVVTTKITLLPNEEQKELLLKTLIVPPQKVTVAYNL